MTDYTDDTMLAKILVRTKIQEARECFHSALELDALGYHTIAAWERALSRQYLNEARKAQTVYR